MQIALYIHIIGAAIWVGGLIVVAALVPAVRKVTDDRKVVRAIANRFGVVSWTALAIQVLTGGWMAVERVWDTTLITKVSLVLVSAGLAGWHTMSARDQSPAVRGAIQGTILILALVIVGLAINV